MSKSKRGSGVIKRAVLFVLLILFVFFSAYVAHNNSHSGRFGDEVGHIVGGKFVLSGKIPYSDLQYNHQPLNYLFSAVVTKVVKADNLYIYITRQREAIFLYAFFWMLVFIFTFSIPGVLFILVFEMSKYWLSGYKLLGETLAVYPFLYMVGVLIGVLFYKKKFNIVTYVLVSVSTFISAFSLLPLWPAILYMNIVFTILLRKSKYCLLALILPALILTLLMFSYLNINDYIRETIIYNYRYFLPSSYGQFSIARMLLMPFMVFLPPYEPYKVVIAFGIGIMVFFSYFAAKSGKIISWMGILLIVLLTNQRMDNFDYSSFHLLPWHGTIIYIYRSHFYIIF